MHLTYFLCTANTEIHLDPKGVIVNIQFEWDLQFSMWTIFWGTYLFLKLSVCMKTFFVTQFLYWYEPPHDKTNKMACAPSEDSDQPGLPPSRIRVFAVRMKKTWVLSYPLSAQRRLWSDWADAQADLSLRWSHTHFVGFVTRQLICVLTLLCLPSYIPEDKISNLNDKEIENLYKKQPSWRSIKLILYLYHQNCHLLLKTYHQMIQLSIPLCWYWY